MREMMYFPEINMVERKHFDPYKIVSDEEFCRNMNSVIAYYQISKGERKQRFVSSSGSKSSKFVLA